MASGGKAKLWSPAGETIDGSLLKNEILQKLQGNAHLDIIEQTLDSVCCGKLPSIDKEISNAKKWLEWAKGEKHLKIVSATVPINGLPEGSSGTMHDVKVFSKGPDDAIYDNNRIYRNKVARGNSFLTLEGGKGPGTVCVTYALKKFTGGLGDDDDRESGDNSTWRRYFTKSMDSAKFVVCTKKANGEAAHLSARKIGGKFIVFAGSKNVHLAAVRKSDIQRYTEPRFRVAGEVAEAIFDFLDSMEEEQKNRLLSFLSLTGYVAIFEMLHPEHQHVEDLSYLEKQELQFITWTSCDLEPSEEQMLCCMPPHVAIEIARSLGFKTVDYHIIEMNEVDKRMKDIRQGYNYEGEVLYFCDSESSVIGLLKKKTIWYIVCRAIREKVRYASKTNEKGGFEIGRAVTKIEKRMKEIQNWLGLKNETRDQWKDLGVGFLRWFIEQQNNGKMRVPDIADMFPVTWGKYLEESKQTDKIDSHWTTEEKPTGAWV